MREAVGGSMLFYIILIFIFVYIVFISVIINYAATYRANNYVVTRIEQTNGLIDLGTKYDTPCNSRGNRYNDTCTLYSVLRDMKYNNDLYIRCDATNSGSIYTVTTEVNFQIPLIGITIPLYINNQTKTVLEPCNTSLVTAN